MFLGITLLVFGGAVILSRRNLRLGRGDRRGAVRLGAYFAAVSLLTDVLAMHNAADLLPAGGLPSLGAAFVPYALWNGVLVWILYVAIEPHVRRVWPETLIGWSRLLGGRLRDPLIGRDILIGALGGLVLAHLSHLNFLVPKWLGLPPPIPLSTLAFLSGGRFTLSALAFPFLDAVGGGVEALFVLFLLTVVLRRRGPATVAMAVLGIAVVPPFGNGNPIVYTVVSAVFSVVTVVLLVRFGLLPMIVAALFMDLLGGVAFSLDSSVPYVFSSYLVLGALVALAAYGFHTALAGQRIFDAGLLKDEPARP